MALLFLDSFDHYATADIDRKYDSGGGTIVDKESLGNPEPRNGKQCLQNVSNGDLTLMKMFPGNIKWIIGVGIRTDDSQGGSADRDIFRVQDFTEDSVNNVQLSLQYVAGSKKFRVVRGNDIIGTELGLSTGTFDLDDAWHFLEFECVINNSTGSFKAQFDGVEIDGLTVTGVDTQRSVTTIANAISLRTMALTPATKLWYDDLYIANGDTPGVISMLGDMKVDALFPKADGNYEEFTTSSGTDSFSLVNELPPTTDDTTYVESQTVNEKSSFDMDDAGNFGIHGAQHVVFLRKTDVNRRKIKHLTRIAGNDHKGDLVRMGDRYTMKTNMWETNPQTGSRWLHSEINGAEFGMEVI